MQLEIERKFFVAGDGWRENVAACIRLQDGLLFRQDSAKLRVRLEPGRALLTLKGPKSGCARREFEYEIPMDDGELLLAEHCEGRVLAKTRHVVQYEGAEWLVDVYEGLLAGTVLAEIELSHPEQPVALPPWIGREVTGNPDFSKYVMLQRALARTVSEAGG